MTGLKIMPTILLMILLSNIIYAQVSRGKVQEGLVIKSNILDKEVRYTVYLPYDYETSSRYYPVVYLLHGYTDSDMGWIQFGEAHLLADEAIASREIPPMILIMPDGGISRYINNFDNSVRYEDFFIKEFIPYIEKTYRIRAEKQYRGIAGLSMGGYGSLVHVLRHPDMFSACAALSAAIYTREEIKNMPGDYWEVTYSYLYGIGLSGEARLTDHLLSYDPINIVNNSDPELIKKVSIYIDCGDDDDFTTGNASLHISLRQLEIPHEYRVRDGKHSWSYWRTGLIDGLKFIGTGFHRP